MLMISARVHRCAAAASLTLLLLTGVGCTGEVPPPVEPSAASPTGRPPRSADPDPTVPTSSTTPVPQPSPGDVNSEVPVEPPPTQKAVELDKTSRTKEVTARLTKIDKLTAEAKGPGEVSGPGLAISVRLTNRTSAVLSLENVVVNLSGADKSPGNPMSDSPAKPFTGSLAAGKSANGVYVFTLAEGKRRPITVEVTTAGGSTVLVFTGNA